MPLLFHSSSICLILISHVIQGSSKALNQSNASSFSSELLQEVRPKWETDFYLDESLLPSYISTSTAQDILFIGKALSTLQSSTKSRGLRPDTIDKYTHDLISLLQIQPFEWRPLQFDRFISRWKNHVAGILWKEVVVGEDFMMNLRVGNERYFFLHIPL